MILVCLCYVQYVRSMVRYGAVRYIQHVQVVQYVQYVLYNMCGMYSMIAVWAVCTARVVCTELQYVPMYLGF